MSDFPAYAVHPAAGNSVERGSALGDAGTVTVPARQIRARCTDRTLTVYRAYSPEIAVPAVGAGRFVAPFRRERMTWIKPSFLWMMYRCGWATKPGQERVLAVEITRAGLEWALARACLSRRGSGPQCRQGYGGSQRPAFGSCHRRRVVKD